MKGILLLLVVLGGEYAAAAIKVTPVSGYSTHNRGRLRGDSCEHATTDARRSAINSCYYRMEGNPISVRCFIQDEDSSWARTACAMQCIVQCETTVPDPKTPEQIKQEQDDLRRKQTEQRQQQEIERQRQIEQARLNKIEKDRLAAERQKLLKNQCKDITTAFTNGLNYCLTESMQACKERLSIEILQ